MQIEAFQYLQISCFLISVICFKALHKWGIALFVALLFLDCVVDLLGDNYKAFGWKDNYLVYNCYLLLSEPLSLFLFYKMLGLSPRFRILFSGFAFLCLLLIVINYCFIQGPSKFNTYSLLLIMILNIIFSCLVLIKLAIDDRKLLPIYREPFFWINAATLLFSLGTLVVLGLQEYIAVKNVSLNGKMLYNVIMPMLNVFLYVALSYGFLLCRIQANKYSTQL